MNKSTVKGPFGFCKTAPLSLKVKSTVKAGGFNSNGANHNRTTIRVSSGLKAGQEILRPNHSRRGKTLSPAVSVTSGLKAGGFNSNGANHNRTTIRVSSGLKAGQEILRPNHSRRGKTLSPAVSVTSGLKAGGFNSNGANHNRKTIRVSSGLKAGGFNSNGANHNRKIISIRVSSGLKAGGFNSNGANHNRKIISIRVSSGLKAGQEILRPNHSRRAR